MLVVIVVNNKKCTHKRLQAIVIVLIV